MATVKFAAAALSAALMSIPAFAQTTAPAPSAPANPPAAAPAPTATAPAATATAPVPHVAAQQTGQYLASKLPGVDVYNNSNEKIGDISELVVDRDGKVSAIVISVGGFLGMGKHDVAVPFNEVQFVDQAPTRSSSAPAATGMPAAPREPTTTGSTNPPATAPAPAATTTSAEPRAYPDRIVINMTVEQLKAAPAFKYGS